MRGHCSGSGRRIFGTLVTSRYPTSIRQRGYNLQLSNESGDNASGQINGKRTLTSTWNGNTIGGTVSTNGNRINWDNGTYWTRFRVYGSQNN